MASRLAVTSSYSLLYGVLQPADIMAVCRKYGIDTVAVSDRESLHGLHALLEEGKEAGIRVIVSVKLPSPEGPIWLFVFSREGYSILTELLSLPKGDQGYTELLASRNEGLIIASTSRTVLSRLKECSSHLYAAITPRNYEGVGHAKKLSLPLAALEDALFTDSSQWEIHRLLRAIALNTTIGSLDPSLLSDRNALIHDEQEYTRIFSAWPESLRGSEQIAHRCSSLTLFDSLIFPSYTPPEGKDSAGELRERVFEGAHRRYGELNDAIIDRIEWELSIICEKGFASYFLIMHDIVRMASRSCGRGSAAASIISYALGITQVDPIAYNLYFERFLTSSREDMPDIDVDFAWDERDEILHKVITMFGEKHCARVANHNLFRLRSAVRETAKAHGLSDGEITRVLKGRDQLIDPHSIWNTVFSLAKRITGLPRALSMHCGGLVITPRESSSYAPVTRSREGYPLLTWEKEGVESAGLVKIDLLGNRSLAVIRDTLESLSKQGIIIDRNTWRPAEDAATVSLLERGESMGVFYIESPAMRLLQKKTEKGDFDHIVIHSSLIRPAANAYVSEYVERVHGKKWEPVHPLFEEIVRESYGIMCYQEDVSKTAIALAGFSEYDGDQLRKVVAKKNREKRLAAYEKQFFEGCRERGIREEVITRIWGMILSFDGYSFCKPHSASYSMVSLQSAFLRAHYPAPFMAAVISNRGGFYSETAYISEARRMGLRVTGPDINESSYRYTGRGSHMIIGFMAIRELSYRSVETILSEREKDGAFLSLEDFSQRVFLPHGDVSSLASSGVFDSIAPRTPRTAQVRTIIISTDGKQRKTEPELFEREVRAITVTSRREGGNGIDVLLGEYRSLGFLRDHHILYIYASELSHIRRIRGYEIPSYVERSVTLAGWPITKRTVITKKSTAMAFVSFEDETTLYETVIFPPVHERYEALIYSQRPLLIRGVVKKDHQAYSIEVTSLAPLT